MNKGAGVSLACQEITGNQHPAERQRQCIDRSTPLPLHLYHPTIRSFNLRSLIILARYLFHSFNSHSLYCFHYIVFIPYMMSRAS